MVAEASSVAPLAGAWIEIIHHPLDDVLFQSLPSRERGLKSASFLQYSASVVVAPLAGAWIEISAFRGSRLSIASLPSRERGLKSWS